MRGEIGHDEAACLAWADVVERPRLDHRQPIAPPVDAHQLPGSQLTDAVGVARPGRADFSQRQLLRAQLAIYLRAGDDHNARPAVSHSRPQQVSRTAGVDGQRLRRFIPGARRVGLAGQMEDEVRLSFLDGRG